MKKLIYLFAAALLVASCDKTKDDPKPTVMTDSISMGQGYANEIFYSLENGQIKNSPRNAWDLAFSTNPMSSTILINEGAGMELYTYPNGDASDWDNIDTSGMGSWKALYNSDSSWYYGAFDRNSTGHPDYGWGVYSMTTHDVMGDSIYVMKMMDGSYVKLFIEKRAASTNTFSIKYGAINEAGSTKEIPCSDYTGKNFVYFNLASGEISDIEPESDSWDLLFTRYYDESIPYIVTGVLTNMDRQVAEVKETDPDLADPADATFSTDISTIGSDWKEFDMGSFSYLVVEDLSYFVRDAEEQLYKVVFTGTDGSATGKMVFTIEKIEE